MIPVNEPLIIDKDIEYVLDALKTGWISSEGKYIRKFEEKFANFLGVKHAITVNNGTDALILAVRALNLPKGSEIIMPSMTIISCALSAIYNNLVPVFVDSEPDTWCIDVNKIEEKITAKTKVIMPVHLFGHPADMDAILNLAEKYDLIVLEDFAEAIGSRYKNKMCGSIGHLGACSFYANKVITTGEGGMCVTNDDEIAKNLQKLKNLAFLPERRFLHHELGFNFRMTNVQAAIGLAQTERAKNHIEKKIWIGKTYNGLLKELEGQNVIQLPTEKEWALNTYWVYGVVLNERLGTNAEEMMKKLLERGVMTRPFFYPLHKQPVFKKFDWYKSDEKMPIAEYLSDYGFYLPSGLTLTEENIQTVVNNVKSIINEHIKNN